MHRKGGFPLKEPTSAKVFSLPLSHQRAVSLAVPSCALRLLDLFRWFSGWVCVLNPLVLNFQQGI